MFVTGVQTCDLPIYLKPHHTHIPDRGLHPTEQVAGCYSSNTETEGVTVNNGYAAARGQETLSDRISC